jgi:hypothetical protein
MKLHYSKKAFFLPAILAAVAITSCVGPGYPGGYGSASVGYGNNPATYGGFRTFNTLPGNYAGNAYFYNGRYYSGGRYETGRYQDQGRSYTNRYYHDGRYYYGGSHAHYPGDGHNHGSSHDQQRGSSSSRQSSHYRDNPQYRGSNDDRDLRYNTTEQRRSSTSPFQSFFQGRE